MRFEYDGFSQAGQSFKVAKNDVLKAFTNISREFAIQASVIIENVLIRAAAGAGPEAFPTQYIDPMLDAAQNVVTLLPGELVVNFEAMGTLSDLVEGYHYKARIDKESHVELPYQGEELKNDTERRYEFWLKVFHGEKYHNFNYAGAWNETIAARLTVWGNRAPQWLLLQYGQEEYEPTISPYPIVEDVTFDLREMFDSMMRLELNLIAAKFNGPKGLSPRDEKGRFVPRK